MKKHWKTAMAWLGGVVGITACESLGIEIGTGMCAYGCPYADYDINITVTDEDGNPIKGIKAFENSYDTEAFATTDKDGHIKAFLGHNSFCSFGLKDVDGEANGGEFEDLYISQESLTTTQTKKGDGWYSGRYDATGTIKMKKVK